jgi:hypothetical protein
MPKGHLMDSQVREVEGAIPASGLRLQDFSWEERDGQWWTGFADLELPTLVYTPDPSFFFSFEYHPPFTTPDGFHHDPGGHQVYFKPGRETTFEHRRQLNWAKAFMAVREWFGFVAREKGIARPEPRPRAPQAELPAERLPPQVAASPHSPSAHPKRERVIGHKANRWLEQEAQRRGMLWTVIGFILLAVLAALAL